MVVNYRDLIVYKKARELTIGIDGMIKAFPKTPQANVIASQMFGSATSIGANIAEGKAKNMGREYLRYITHAQGSANETDHWLNTVLDCQLATAEATKPLLGLTLEVLKILVTARATLSKEVEAKEADARRPHTLREQSPAYEVNTTKLIWLNENDWDFELPPDWPDPLELAATLTPNP